MAIDWTHFTPMSALAGGALIGIAAMLLAALTGRIAGISGIVGGLLRPHPGEIGWRVAFVVGLMSAPVLYALLGDRVDVQIDASNAMIVAGGLLVGVGTRLGSGCTSGHGVCGLARRSPRSVAATLTFMAAGFFTVFLSRHVFA